MSTSNEPDWLSWAKKLQAIAQTGLAYTENPFDIDRYQQIADLSAEIFAAHTDLSVTDWQQLLQHDRGYATPKVIVRAVVFDQQKILLVRERRDNGWTLPGGFADVGESPSANAEREVWEESGYRVKAKRLLAVYDRRLHPHPSCMFDEYVLYFQCELLGGEATTSTETSAVNFFSKAEIADLTFSLPRTLPEHVLQFFEDVEQISLATWFD